MRARNASCDTVTSICRVLADAFQIPPYTGQAALSDSSTKASVCRKIESGPAVRPKSSQIIKTGLASLSLLLARLAFFEVRNSFASSVSDPFQNLLEWQRLSEGVDSVIGRCHLTATELATKST